MFKKLRTTDGRVEVESVSVAHCAEASTTVRLRAWVNEADLAPVLTRSIERRFRDGTSIALRPGVPLVALGDGRYRTLADGLAPELAIDARHVGHSYRDVPRPKVPADADPFPGRLPLRYDGDNLVRGEPAMAWKRLGKGLWSLRGRCGDYRLRSSGTTEEGAHLATIFGRDSALGLDDGPFLSRGTALSWRDGHAAGEVTAERLRVRLVEHVGERACFDVDVAAWTARVCASRDDVHDLKEAMDTAIDNAKR